VPVVFVVAKLEPEVHTLLFALSALAIVPLATLLQLEFQGSQRVPNGELLKLRTNRGG
jgi:hypothetical protein